MNTRTKGNEKKSETRISVRLTGDVEAQFLDAMKTGYGQKEIVEDCLRIALPQVKKELAARRAEEMAKMDYKPMPERPATISKRVKN